MKHCCELAISAGKKDHDTFGAALVSGGEVIAEAGNTADDERACSGMRSSIWYTEIAQGTFDFTETCRNASLFCCFDLKIARFPTPSGLAAPCRSSSGVGVSDACIDARFSGAKAPLHLISPLPSPINIIPKALVPVEMKYYNI